MEAYEHKAATNLVRSEAKAAREKLETYRSAETSRLDIFLRSKDFLEILGPKAYRFFKVGF